MDNQTIITIVTTITAAIVTVVGLLLKDRADQRRWDSAIERGTARHNQNSAKLDTIQEEVNGKLSARIREIAREEIDP